MTLRDLNLSSWVLIEGSWRNDSASWTEDRTAGAWSVWHLASMRFAIWMAQSSALSSLSLSMDPMT